MTKDTIVGLDQVIKNFLDTAAASGDDLQLRIEQLLNRKNEVIKKVILDSKIHAILCSL